MLKKLFNFFLGLHKTPKNHQELIQLLRSSEDSAVLDPTSLSFIESVMQGANMRVDEVMVPKAQVIFIDENTTYEEIVDIASKSNHSRFPVMHRQKEEIIGVLLAKDLLHYSKNNDSKNFNLKKILRNTITVPESKKIYELLKEFQKTHNHLAIVVDEYGHLSGILTIEDVLEQIVGEIEDEHDIEEELNILQHEKNKFSVKAATPIEEFNEYFNCEFSDHVSDTIGGVIVRAFKKIPSRNDSIHIGKFKFTILRADKRKIYLVRVFTK